MHLNRSPFLALLLLLLALASSTHAQQPATTNIPEDARGYFIQANTLYKTAQNKTDYQQAVSLYKQALQIAPHFGNCWYNLSKVQEKLELYDDAIASIKQFLADSPNDPDARAAQDHVYELMALKSKSARLADSPEAKAQALRAKLAGLRVVHYWYCGIHLNNGRVQWCNDFDAAASNWHDDTSFPSTTPIKVSLIGPANDIIALTLFQNQSEPYICINAKDYQDRDDFTSGWYMCPAGWNNYHHVVIEKFSLNSSWSGTRAFYLQTCFWDIGCPDNGGRIRGYYVLGN
jgi:tetratricopeptide (TPR) repeat protein